MSLVKSLPHSSALSLPHGLTGGGGLAPTNMTLTGTLPDGNQGTDYLGILNISGGTAPYSNPTVTAGSLPVGFSLAIVGTHLQVTATAPIAFSGVISATLRVQDSLGAHASLAVTFTIAASGFIATEAGNPMMTEDGKFLVTET